MRVYIKEAFKKASAVIESCENRDHINCAINFIDNYYKVYNNSQSYGMLHDILIRKTAQLGIDE